MEETTRQEQIHSKGFNMERVAEYGKIKVGKKTVEDAVYNFSTLGDNTKAYSNKAAITKALINKDIPTLREISNYYYRTSGIYFRVCNYFA